MIDILRSVAEKTPQTEDNLTNVTHKFALHKSKKDNGELPNAVFKQ